MTGDDWTDYSTQPAPRTLLCQFRRGDKFFNYVAYAKDFDPAFNIAGLEWKLTGIAREQLDWMSEAMRRQVMCENYGPAARLLAQSTMSVQGIWPGEVFDGLLMKRW